MEPRIVGAVLARDEAGRYLERVLRNVTSLCDVTLLLDDDSQDATPDIARAMGALVQKRAVTGGFWGGEGRGSKEGDARRELWTLAATAAGRDGWVYIADADHELVGITRDELHTLVKATHATAFACPLWDCWDDDEHMRTDSFWKAHENPRAWLFKAFPHGGLAPEWDRRGLHVGHSPSNFVYTIGLMPNGVGIKHLGYIREADRRAKANKYLSTLH